MLKPEVALSVHVLPGAAHNAWEIVGVLLGTEGNCMSFVFFMFHVLSELVPVYPVLS